MSIGFRTSDAFKQASSLSMSLSHVFCCFLHVLLFLWRFHVQCPDLSKLVQMTLPLYSSCQLWPSRIRIDKVRGSRISAEPTKHMAQRDSSLMSCCKRLLDTKLFIKMIKMIKMVWIWTATGEQLQHSTLSAQPSFCFVFTTKMCLQFKIDAQTQTLMTHRCRTSSLFTTCGAIAVIGWPLYNTRFLLLKGGCVLEHMYVLW